jgi:general secretion pathway protein E/type IV pilus assembly protein PilB
MDSDMDDLLAQGATTKEIKEAAYHKGFFTLADDGIRHIIEGVTSIKEVARVADLTGRME